MKTVHKMTIIGAAVRLRKKWPRLSKRLMMILFEKEECRHVFHLSQIGPKREDGRTEWACKKCSKMFALNHPMQAPGEVVFDIFDHSFMGEVHV